MQEKVNFTTSIKLLWEQQAFWKNQKMNTVSCLFQLFQKPRCLFFVIQKANIRIQYIIFELSSAEQLAAEWIYPKSAKNLVCFTLNIHQKCAGFLKRKSFSKSSGKPKFSVDPKLQLAYEYKYIIEKSINQLLQLL